MADKSKRESSGDPAVKTSGLLANSTEGDEFGVIESLQEAIVSQGASAGTHLQLIDLLIASDQSREDIASAIERAICTFPKDRRFFSRKIIQMKNALEEAVRIKDEAKIELLLAEIDALNPPLIVGEYAKFLGALIVGEQYTRAAQLLGAAETAVGRNTTLTHYRALLCYRQKKLPQAEKIWKKLADEEPTAWRVATTHRARIAINQARRGDAVELYEQLWTRHPDHDEAALFLFRDRVLANDLGGMRLLRDAIAEKRPDTKLLATCEAMIANSNGNPQAAETLLRGAVERWSDQIDVWLQLTDHYRHTGQFDQALLVIEEMRELFPTDRRPLDRKFNIYLATADNERMLAFLDEMLAEYPDRIDLYIRKARVLANGGLRREAIEICREGLVRDCGATELWRIGIGSYLNLNEPASALEFLDEALNVFPEDDPASLLDRSELLLAGEQYAAAAHAAKEALRLAPSNLKARLNLARATEALGDWEAALKHYQKAAGCAADRQQFAADMARMAKARLYVETRLGLTRTELSLDLAEEKPTDGAIVPRQGPKGVRLYPHAIFQALVAGDRPSVYKAKPELLHVTSSLGPGGAERQLAINAIEQKKRQSGLKPIVAAQSLSKLGSRDFFQADIEAAGIKVVCLGNNLDEGCVRNFVATHPQHREQLAILSALPANAVRLAAPLYCEIIMRRPAVLHLWQDMTAAIGGLVGYLAGVPRIILSTRSTRPIDRLRARPYLETGFKALLSLPHVEMINNSRKGADDYKDWLNEKDLLISTVYNGYDFKKMSGRSSEGQVRQIRSELGCNSGDALFGGVMRLSAEKRPELWLETAIALVLARRNLQAVLVGDGPMMPTLIRRVQDAGLSDRISIVGAKSPVEPWMAAMDLLFLSSITEGLPNVLIEAQSLGTCIAATDVGGASETFLNNETGILVPANASGGHIAQVLSPLFDDLGQLAAMGRAGAGWVRRTFSIDTTAGMLEQLYQRRQEQDKLAQHG